MNIEQARFNMIEQQIRPWDVLDAHILETLQRVPREEFVPDDQRALAFVDTHIPLGHGQVMTQPKQEARLIQALAPTSKQRVLEVGTGSGYLTALLAHLCAEVDSVDLYPDFIKTARKKLTAHGFNNAHLFEGDAARGWDGDGPYDAVILTGSVPILPHAFVHNLKPNGCLVAVVGQDPIMEALKIETHDNGATTQESLFDISLPPLLNCETPSAFVF